VYYVLMKSRSGPTVFKLSILAKVLLVVGLLDLVLLGVLYYVSLALRI